MRDHVEMRFDYREDRAAPGRAVPAGELAAALVLVARDARTDTWRSVPARLDAAAHPGRPPVHPRRTAGRGLHVVRAPRDGVLGLAVHTRIAVDAPAEEVLARINPTVGVVEAVDDDTCVLVTGGDSVEIIAVYIGMLGLDFTVTEPPELVAHLATLAKRYAAPSAGRQEHHSRDSDVPKQRTRQQDRRLCRTSELARRASLPG